jgi:hypothetical protein
LIFKKLDDKEPHATLIYSFKNIIDVVSWIRRHFDDREFPLANSVTKLKSGIEVDGLGKAIYESIEHIGDMPHAQGASFLGVALEHLGITTWNGQQRSIAWTFVPGLALDDIEDILSSSDFNHDHFPPLPPPPQPPGSHPPQIPPSPPGGGPNNPIIGMLVRNIHQQPYQPIYRKGNYGAPVTGWGGRLLSYFWPNPATNYQVAAAQVQVLIDDIAPFAQSVRAEIENSLHVGRPIIPGTGTTAIDQAAAVAAATNIHVWGGVPQRSFTWQTLWAVLQSAIVIRATPGAPMNSGWTKVAAFGTNNLGGGPGQHPQAIWDSRVATSLTYRLDGILSGLGLQPAAVFPGIGTVAGRGGTRPRPLRLRWPNGYGNWKAQFSGSRLIELVRDEVNRLAIPMPLPTLGFSPWTIRGIEQVLFMDGY